MKKLMRSEGHVVAESATPKKKRMTMSVGYDVGLEVKAYAKSQCRLVEGVTEEALRIGLDIMRKADAHRSKFIEDGSGKKPGE